MRSASVIGAFLVLFCVVTRGPARANDVGASSPDLIVRVGSDATGPVDKGHAIRYTLAVQNVGGSIAHHVTVEDALPRGVTPINLLPTIEGGTCSAVGSTDPGSTYTVVCSRATLAPAESASVTIDARVDRDRRCGTIRSVVTVGAADEPSTARGDDTASHADVVRCETSLRVEAHGPTFARAGGIARTTFHILNDGEVPLHGLTLAGTECSGLGGGLDPGLRPDHRRAVTCGVRITVGDDAPAVSVHVTAISPEGRRVEASASSTIRVIHPGVSLSLPTAPVSGRPRDGVTIGIVVTNTGDSALRGIVVAREGAGIVGRVGTLGAGRSVTVKATERLPRAPATSTLRFSVAGTDRSGARVSAHATVSLTVLSKHSPAHHLGTAFTGSDTGNAAEVFAILLALGIAAGTTASRRVRRAPPR